MGKILKMSDRIKLTIGEVVFTIAPLSYIKKQELMSCTRMSGGKEVYDLLKAQALYIKYSLKDISGLTSYDGSNYELAFEGDSLTDECVDEILNIDQRELLTVSAWQILNGIQELQDPNTGEKLEGVTLEVESSGNLKSQADQKTL